MQPIVYPLYDRNKRLSLNLPKSVAECVNAADSGNFLLGKNCHWHGGVHLAHPSGDSFSDIVVQSIAHGKVVAYRLHEDWEKEEYTGKSLQYSRNFVLIEHNLETPYHNKEKIFTGYKFFSLYMHIAPAKVLQEKQALPWFLAATRHDLETDKIIARASRVELFDKEGNAAASSDTPHNLALNGLVQVEFAPEGGTSIKAWLPVGMVAYDKVARCYVTAQPIKYYFTDHKATLNAAQLNQLQVLRKPVVVSAGDTLGMAGGTIVQDSFQDKLMHFEIFAKDIDFLEYKIKESRNIYRAASHTLAVYYKSKNITNRESFAAGRFYYKPALASTGDSTVVSALTSGNGWKTYDFIGSNEQVTLTPVAGKHYLVEKFKWGAKDAAETIEATITPVLEVVSDAQWKEGPYAWKELRGSDFLMADGFWNRCTTPEKTEHVLVKERSEWRQQDVKGRFKNIKEELGASYDNFISFIEGHCFWKEVSSKTGLPGSGQVWHFHPIGFVEQLRRLLTPYHNADPMKLQRYLERLCNETLRYSKNRLKELKDWKNAGLPESQDPTVNATYHALAKSFYIWFGYPYSPAMTIYSAYNNNAPGPKTPLSLPVVTTLHDAVDKVIGITERSINAFEKQIDVSNMMHGFSGKDFVNASAYVRSDEDMKNIHLCLSFMPEPESIDNNAKRNISKIEIIKEERGNNGVRFTTTTSREYRSHGDKTMAHECSHFYDIGLLGVGADKRGLYDLYVKDTTTNKIYGPYEHENCMEMGRFNPSATLCNADNYANFIVGKERFDDEDTYNYF